MSKRKFSVVLWTLAFVLSLTFLTYQRITGPTYPVRGSEQINGKKVTYKLLRSYTEWQELPVVLDAPDPAVGATLFHKRYKTNDAWTAVAMKREGNNLTAEIPGQAYAGKVQYKIDVSVDGKTFPLHQGKTIIARFKGSVPMFFIIAHVLFMLLSFVLGFRTGLETLRKDGQYNRLINWTLGFTIIGGLILGPIIQEYAFKDFWTGFPFGIDLTDNKLLIAVILWLFAFFMKKKSKWWVFAAAVVMVIVYLIPHSVLGSERDYESGKMRNKLTMIIKTNSIEKT